MEQERADQKAHPAVPVAGFASDEELVNHLMNRKAYEYAASRIRSQTVLDWGCNNGYGIEILRASGCSRVAGIDVAPAMIDAARSRLPSDVDLFLYEGRSAPIPSGAFDVVTSFQCIEHVDDQSRYLGEIQRVLRQNGFAMFTTPNAAIRLDPGMSPWNPFHVREFRANELRALLEAYFGEVELFGLFGTAEIMKVELARCARNRALRRTGSVAVLEGFAWRIRSAVLHRARTWRPRAPQFSTAQLFYSSDQTDSLDLALDLLAVCRSPRTPAKG